MTNYKPPELNKTYILVVFVLTILFPAISIFIEWETVQGLRVSIGLVGKWFIFYAVGIRLFIAGLRQTITPSFTAKEIFHLKDDSSYPIIRELGFANLCFGLIGIISLFLPQWRIVSAVGSGLYYGIAGFHHLVKRPAGPNELFALVSDFFIFLVLLLYVLKVF
jgi:hypothetical protein